MKSSQSIALVFSPVSDGSAIAQTNWAQVAVPAYSPARVLHAPHQNWTPQWADDFARQAQALPLAIKVLCDAQSLLSKRSLRRACSGRRRPMPGSGCPRWLSVR